MFAQAELPSHVEIGVVRNPEDTTVWIPRVANRGYYSLRDNPLRALCARVQVFVDDEVVEKNLRCEEHNVNRPPFGPLNAAITSRVIIWVVGAGDALAAVQLART